MERAASFEQERQNRGVNGTGFPWLSLVSRHTRPIIASVRPSRVVVGRTFLRDLRVGHYSGKAEYRRLSWGSFFLSLLSGDF